MTFFAVTYTYDPTKDADAVRPSHREYLGKLCETGALRASGPTVGTTPATALLIMEAETAQIVEDLLDADPMKTEGIVMTREVTEWNPVIGIFA